MFPVGGVTTHLPVLDSVQYRQVCGKSNRLYFIINWLDIQLRILCMDTLMQISMEIIIQISTTYNYIDELSVTHGQSPCTHIWTWFVR